MEITRKDWDSDLFGIAVAQADIESGMVVRATKLLEAGAGQFDLIYIFSPSPIATTETLFTDCKVELNHLLIKQGLPRQLLHIRPYCGEAVLPQLLSLAKQSGEYSRFKLDTRLGEKYFDLLYETWLNKSISKAIADEVLIAWDDAGTMLGFVTLALKNACCEIGLLAVDALARGRGVGKDLMEASRQYAIDNNRLQLTVATQERNANAIGFYEACGFKIFKRTYIAHFWTK